jgi:hypothetical protein
MYINMYIRTYIYTNIFIYTFLPAHTGIVVKNKEVDVNGVSHITVKQEKGYGFEKIKLALTTYKELNGDTLVNRGIYVCIYMYVYMYTHTLLLMCKYIYLYIYM